MEIILLILAGLAIKYVSDANQFIKNIQFTFSDISLDFQKTLNSGFTQLFLNLKTNVVNPTDFDITLLAIYSDVYYQDTLLGSFNVTGSITIAKQGTTTKVVPVTINIVNAIDVVKNVISNGGNLTFRFKGYADITLGRIAFDQTNTFSL